MLLRVLAKSWKFETLGDENMETVDRGRRGFFAALWHGRMVMGLVQHSDLIGGHANFHVLVSQSGDGDVARLLLKRFRYKVIRGSSSRGGARALREMLQVLSTGAALIITPDGPRGPRHSMNPGLAWMAKATGAPILPCGFACDRAWYRKSWDRFTIPKWRARVTAIYGEPVYVARSAGPAELDAATRKVHEEMVKAEKRGFDYLARDVDW